MEHKLITDHRDRWLLVEEQTDLHKDCWTYRSGVLTYANFITVGHKVIACLPKHKDAPKLEGVWEIIELSEQCNLCEGSGYYGGGKSECPICNGKETVAAQQKKYSDEDMINFTEWWALEKAKWVMKNGDKNIPSTKDFLDKYLQSLSPVPKMPIGFEPEYLYERSTEQHLSGGRIDINKGFKVVNNVLQGKWLF